MSTIQRLLDFKRLESRLWVVGCTSGKVKTIEHVDAMDSNTFEFHGALAAVQGVTCDALWDLRYRVRVAAGSGTKRETLDAINAVEVYAAMLPRYSKHRPFPCFDYSFFRNVFNNTNAWGLDTDDGDRVARVGDNLKGIEMARDFEAHQAAVAIIERLG